MRQKIAMALACAWMAAAAAGATAEEIYRCGTSYSNKPCPGGQQVQAADPRSASERAQAGEAAKRDAKAADAMEKARLKEEAKPAPVVVLSGKTINQPAEAPKPAASAKARSTKAKKPADFRAVAPKSP
jgi:hypothetical protein